MIGRVHWLLWHLPSKFKGAYILSYNYAKHNYVFYRMRKNRLYDIFIVTQTSKHYWKMTYTNLAKNRTEYFGYHKTSLIAEVMNYIYLENLYP